MDGKDVQPVEQILPKTTFLDLLQQISVGGGNDPDVNFDGPDAPDPFKLMVLQDVEELDLHIPGEIADFIQENGAGMGKFEAARFGDHGAREGPLFVTEQFTLNQMLRDRPAVDLNERIILPGAVAVYSVGDQFLPGPCFPGEQHRRCRRCDLPDRFVDIQHLLTGADDAVPVDIFPGS